MPQAFAAQEAHTLKPDHRTYFIDYNTVPRGQLAVSLAAGSDFLTPSPVRYQPFQIFSEITIDTK
jgi:hypothetical protein